MQSPSLPPLVPTGQFTVHGHGAEMWYALQAPDKRYIRMGRKEYLIASALDGRRSAAQVVAAVAELEPTLQCSEDDVQQVSNWLATMGLLKTTLGPSTTASSKSALSLNPIYCKIPLIAGHHLESWSVRLLPLLSWPLIALTCIVWLFGGLSVVWNWEMLAGTTSELFVADRWLWWCLAWLVLKSAHELGHAVMAVRVGSQIRAAGLSFIFMAPVPFVDLSDLWAIPNRWQRGLVCASGMLVEITLAALAALLAVCTENQSLQYFCCALATMGTITTVAFNASPFIRFDGYFILSDLINYPNLYSDAQSAAKQFLAKCLFPWRSKPRATSAGLVAYGLACYQYRLVMMISLAVGTILAMQGVGLLLVAWGAYILFVAPWLAQRASHQSKLNTAAMANKASLLANPTWYRTYRETMLSALVVAGLVWLVVTMPTPFQPACPGTIALHQPHLIRAETDGFLAEVFVRGSGQVKLGEVIARLSNPELETELALKNNELAQLDEKIALKRARGHLAELQAAEAQRGSLALQVQQLEDRVDNLFVRSPRDGQLVRNELTDQLGLFLTAGKPLAMVARQDELEVLVSVSQLEVARWRAAEKNALATHIVGGPRWECVLETVEPRAHHRLTEPLLAACYGGPLAVEPKLSASGEEELQLHQPRFDARLRWPTQHSPDATAGQMVWVRTPGQAASLWDSFSDWCQQQWQRLLREQRPS